MKRLFVTLAALGFFAAAALGQDVQAGVEILKAGVESFAENKELACNQFTEALGIFEAVEEPEDAEQLEQLNEYKAQCKDLIVKSLLGLAKENIRDAKYEEALALLDKTIAKGEEYGVAEEVESAKELIPAVYKQKANSLMKAEDYTAAIAAWNDVIAQNPEDGTSYLLLGQATMKTGDLDGAIAAFEKANDLGQANAAKLLSNCYLKKGQAYLKAGKNAEAIQALEKSNEYIPSGNAYKLLASANLKSGKSSAAIDAYKKYLEVQPNAKDAADIQFTIAATAQKAGDKATAKEYYNMLKGNAKYGAQAEAQLKAL